MCGVCLVSLARNLAATTGSDSVPKEKASLQALPVAPQPASEAALADYVKTKLHITLKLDTRYRTVPYVSYEKSDFTSHLSSILDPKVYTDYIMTRRAAPSQSQRFYSRRFAPIIVVPH